jgi:hypothetical protein
MRTGSGRRSRLAAFASLFAVVLVLGAAGAALAGDDEDDDTVEQKIIKKFLGGLGVDVGQGSGIEYRERSPLVIPPSRDLPPPESADAIKHPAWPKDPDAQPKKRAAKSKGLDSIGEYNMHRATLSPEELRRGQGAAPGTGPVTEPKNDPMDNSNEYGSRPLSPSKLGVPTIFGLFGKKNEQTQFVREPDRTLLTQPPPGYQTPSPSYPYGVGQEKNTSTLDMPQVKDPHGEGSIR